MRFADLIVVKRDLEN